MEKDIPLKIEILSGGDNDRHRIVSAKEIEFVLHCIAEKRSRVALYYGNENDFILTTVLGVDNTGLWLEKSPSDADNRRIAGSGKLVFVGSHSQVKIQFTASRASDAEYHGYPAFYFQLPESIYRLQRREYYRLIAPVSEPLRCVIATGKTPAMRPREMTIMDISVGGIGLACAETDIELVPGTSYPDCQINLPGMGAISGTIEVKNLVLLTSPSGHTHKRAGCEFKNLDSQSIVLIQRYVTNMQRKGKI
ncbi:MAG: flagellar brake protein [Methylococcaceae bacterium]|nr:MAG: flagellar brake protein [Methylococcaceae bacterium]